MPKLKPKYFQGFIHVKGDGAFPFDMLRYDRCFPASQDDVSRLLDDGPRTIHLIMAAETLAGLNPTKGRWESFGWEAN